MGSIINKIISFVVAVSFVFATIPCQQVSAATDVKNDATLSTSLIAYWDLDETSGTRADSHTGGYDLTDNNTVGYATGIIGNAADCETSASEFLSIANKLGTTANTDFSISMWLKRESNPSTSGYFGVFDLRRDNGSTDDMWALRFYRYTDGFNYYNPIKNSDDFFKDTTDTLPIGTWKHVVITYDYDVGVKIYVNTSLTVTYNTTAASPTVSADAFNLCKETSVTAYWDGLIDEVAVWSKVVSSGEISDLYNSGSGIPYDAGGAAAAATSTTPVRINGGSLRIQGGTFKNTQL
jgi:hypothetical protein